MTCLGRRLPGVGVGSRTRMPEANSEREQEEMAAAEAADGGEADTELASELSEGDH